MLAKQKQAIIFVVDRNTSASTLAKQLKNKQLILSERVFLFFIKIKGLAPHLRAGIYEILPGESTHQFLEKVVGGKVLVQAFRVIEGTTINQVKANLARAPFLKYTGEDWKIITTTYPNLEGLLLADTYYYNAGSEGKALLRLAHQSLLRYLDSCWKTRSVGLPYHSSYELLIVASILEKETALPKERRIISGIIINRLKKNMLLQMDPTVIYALGSQYHGKLLHEDLTIRSPYNTYRNRGLPPTPIAIVSRDALNAAAHPKITNYLYFVAKGDGTHQFSSSYEEQKQAITQFHEKGYD